MVAFKFNQLLKFPCNIDFRIIVDASYENFYEDIKQAATEVVHDEKKIKNIKGKGMHSSKGNYISYIIPINVSSQEELLEVYKKIGNLSFVRHII